VYYIHMDGEYMCINGLFIVYSLCDINHIHKQQMTINNYKYTISTKHLLHS
jgi:hypothetical protein